MRTETAPVRAAEMPRPPANTVQIGLRVPEAWLEEIDEIAKYLSKPGMEASRTDAFRHAIRVGIDASKADRNATKRSKK